MGIEDNKSIARRFVREVLQELDGHAVDDLVAEDFVSHTWRIAGPDARQSLKEATRRIGDALSEIRFDIEDVIAEGDRVAVRLTSSAKQTGQFQGMPATNRRYEIGEIHILRIADGLIAEHWHQYDLPAMTRQLSGPTESA